MAKKYNGNNIKIKRSPKGSRTAMGKKWAVDAKRENSRRKK